MYQIESLSNRKQLADSSKKKEHMRVQMHILAGTPNPEQSEKDPVWCATDHFSTIFEEVGQNLSLGKAMSGYTLSSAQKQNGVFLRAFGKIAFSRGNLAAGIFRGQGKLMLISCLKRTCRSHGSRSSQESLSGSGSLHERLPDDASMVYNSGAIESAVGLVTQSLHGARRQLLAFRRAIRTDKAPDTLAELYPFLNTKDDKEQKERYLMQLKDLEHSDANTSEMEVLRYGIDRITAILQKKEQQREEFLIRLNELLIRARKAEKELSSERYIQSAVSAVLPAEHTDSEETPSIISGEGIGTLKGESDD